jgi:S-adenosylmethionine hydrolase
MPILTLLTDFGIEDEYVGVMKGVILSIAPHVRLVDLSHQIPPQDVRRAALLLSNAAPFFPPDTVHLAVVDPGVGTERRPLAIRTPVGTFVGPDNGLFSYVLAEVPHWVAVELRNPAYWLPRPSFTFHGRDIFAPTAAHLAAGAPLESLGPRVTDLKALPLPRLEMGDRWLEGEVLYADRFGNLVTSIGRFGWERDHLVLVPAFSSAASLRRAFPAATVRVVAAGLELQGVRRTYGEVPAGTALALIGSHSFLEIAVREGNAAEQLGLQVGGRVQLFH